jgi:agmatine deiminase
MFEAVPAVIAQMVRELATGEMVHINVADAAMEESARVAIRAARAHPDRVRFHHHATNDAWCRDHGPIFLDRAQHGRHEQLILDWGYNAWGNKYPPFDLDDTIPTRVGAELGVPVEYPGMILEGGSIDVNGQGTLLTTTSCLLNPNRNPELSQRDIEQRLCDWLGVTKVLWLGDGIVGDDTDGHIDDLSRFVDAQTIVTVVEEDPRDENHAPLADNAARLRRMTDQSGRPFRVIDLPMPPALSYDNQRVPASYANFYIANDVVLLPGYDAATDEKARSVLQGLFPSRRVVVIDCGVLIWGLGAFHCLTQQWPE